jgi:hypothetical protein
MDGTDDEVEGGWQPTPEAPPPPPPFAAKSLGTNIALGAAAVALAAGAFALLYSWWRKPAGTGGCQFLSARTALCGWARPIELSVSAKLRPHLDTQGSTERDPEPHKEQQHPDWPNWSSVGLRAPLVIDLGSGFVRAGSAQDELEPSTTLSNVIGRRQAEVRAVECVVFDGVLGWLCAF